MEHQAPDATYQTPHYSHISWKCGGGLRNNTWSAVHASRPDAILSMSTQHAFSLAPMQIMVPTDVLYQGLTHETE